MWLILFCAFETTINHMVRFLCSYVHDRYMIFEPIPWFALSIIKLSAVIMCSEKIM